MVTGESLGNNEKKQKAMNKKYLLSALAGVAVLFSACSDDIIETGNGTIKNPGDEILFISTADYENAEEEDSEGKTRTIYTGEIGTNNGQKYEGVHWIVGDRVRIFCPEAHDEKHVDYEVTASNTGVASGKEKDYKHQTSLVSTDGKVLKWSDGSKPHNFYAIYPAPTQYNPTNTLNSFGDNSSVITGYIPQTQLWEAKSTKTIDNSDISKIQSGQFGGTIPEGTEIPATGTWHVFEPNMDYAYMVAKTVVNNPNESDNKVSLDFMPIATAVEITLRNVAWKDGVSPEQTKIDIINIGIRSDKSPLFGGFTADLAEINVNASTGMGYDLPSNVSVSNEYAKGNVISLSMLDADNGEKGSPLTLNYGDAVTFTVFVLPTDNIDDLQITINGVQGAATGTLKGITVKKHKKTFLNQVPITGDVLPFTYANWMRFIDNATFVRRLSIPGTGGSASYALAAGGSTQLPNDASVTVKHDMVRQQTVDIATQWNKGVRVFEFSVDLATDGSGNLGNSEVICSGISTGVKLSEAINEIRTKMDKHPYECAMAIITYETSGGWSGTRNPSEFINQLNSFWTAQAGVKVTSSVNSNITIQTALYDPSTATMGNSRGKLFCIARPTSEHQDYGMDVVDTNGYSDAKMNNNGTVGPVCIEAGKRHGFLANPIADWPDMKLPNPHEHIMAIHGWGTLKDKWQQRGYTNYSVRGTGTSNTFNLEYENVKYGSETTAEPGRPFDGLQYHTHNDGWGSITWAPTVEEEEQEATYSITITPETSNTNTRLTVSSVTIGGKAATESNGSWVVNYGTTKPSGDLAVSITYTCSYNSADTDENTSWSRTINVDSYNFTKFVYTFTATASRSGSSWWGYTYSYSYSMSGPKDGSSGSGSSSSTSGTYYGNAPVPSNYAITASVISKLTPDFSYDVVAGSNTVTNGAWVQEWERVSNSETEYRDHTATSCRDAKSGCSGPYASYWAPSYDEKIQRVKEALNHAMNKKYGDITYINSLCGYYITADYPASFAPCSLTDFGYGSSTSCGSASAGKSWNEMWVLSASSPISGMGGDIASFADKINTDFYNHLLGTDTDYEAGSMGIILLNRVNGTAGSKIPGIVIANNFRFEITENSTDMGAGEETVEPEAAPRNTGNGFSLSWW